MRLINEKVYVKLIIVQLKGYYWKYVILENCSFSKTEYTNQKATFNKWVWVDTFFEKKTFVRRNNNE